MAVHQSLRNEFTCLEAGARQQPRVCTRCKENEVVNRARLCGPCQVVRYEECKQARLDRANGSYRKQIKAPPKVKFDTIHDLGHAARKAGLTVAAIEAMAPRFTPEEERLLDHG
jgi:hypothetical protein